MMIKPVLRSALLATAAALGLLLVTVVALLVMPLPSMPEPARAGDFLVRNINIIDVTDGRVLANRDITIRQGVITAINVAGNSDAASHGQAAELIEIDGQGKYALPGLWDMHSHSTSLAEQYLHPLFLANGVTGLRDMWGCMDRPDSYIACQDQREAWSTKLREGSIRSPRFVLQSSFQINGGNEVPEGYPDFFKARTPQEAQQLASYYAGKGVDFLKTYSQLTPSAYLALAEAAKNRQLTLAGHRPFGISLQQAITAGQRSIEHPRLFLLECYRQAAQFRAEPEPLVAYTMALRQRLVSEHDDLRCGQLMRTMAQSTTAWTPTLQVLRMSARADDISFRVDERLRYIPWVLEQGMWQGDADRAAARARTGPYRDADKAMYRMAQVHVGQAHAAGVELLVGTDATDTYVFPGFSVHDELAEFVVAGIVPAEVLKIATLGAAQYAGVGQDFGSIEVGKVADILLLNSNPLQDINATKSIHGLLFNGQFFNRGGLDQLLLFGAAQASSLQFNLQLLWRMLSSPIVRVQLAD
jgi:hypothetical protein